MALAQRLNDLALANSNGLLNDDEYRLLRQNVFEEYSSNVVVPVEAPVVPIAARLDVHVRTRASAGRATTPPSTNHQRILSKHSHDSRKSIATPARQKSSVTAGVASLIRKATGRRTPVPIHEPSTTPAKDSHKLDIVDHESPHKFMVILPKLLQRKPSTLRKDLPKPLSDTWSSSRSTNTSSSTSNTSHSISLQTPTRGYSHPANISSSSLRLSHSHDKSPSTPRDVFDDENLDTAKDIRSSILITEDELQTLTDAFNNLESTALRRVQKQNARRLPANTPTSVDVLLEGREWREHRLIPSSPSSPSLDASSRRSRILRSFDSNGSGDGHSIRSSSSNQTSLSQSRSVTSIPKVTPASSPLSATFLFRNTTRSNSISSSSSQGASSFTSGGMLAPTLPAVSLTRSASHLSLRHRPKAPSGITSVSQETIFRPSHDGDDEEVEDDPELVDIRRRREEVIARYTARLDFLRAKLKGAELHEKLLRK